MALKDFLAKHGLVELEDDKPNTVVSKPSSSNNLPFANKTQSTEPAPYTYTPVTSTPNEAEVQKVRDYFDKLFTDANLPGPDYLEFISTVNDLQSQLQLTLDQAFKSAYISLKIKKDVLLSSIGTYLQVLNTDNQTFQNKLAAKNTSEVGNNKNKITALEEENRKKLEQVQQLEREIQSNKDQIITLGNAIIEEEAKLKQRNLTYQQEFAIRKQKLQEDLERITTQISN